MTPTPPDQPSKELAPADTAATTPVERGVWYDICPVCGVDWNNGQLWIDRNGPPCKHLTICFRGRPDGAMVQWMTVTYFPRLRAIAQRVGRFLMFPFYAVYMTRLARRARQRP